MINKSWNLLNFFIRIGFQCGKLDTLVLNNAFYALFQALHIQFLLYFWFVLKFLIWLSIQIKVLYSWEKFMIDVLIFKKLADTLHKKIIVVF